MVRNGTGARAVEQTKNNLAQEVTYKTSIIDKVTDVTNAMNMSINPSIRAIFYGNVDVLD